MLYQLMWISLSISKSSSTYNAFCIDKILREILRLIDFVMVFRFSSHKGFKIQILTALHISNTL